MARKTATKTAEQPTLIVDNGDAAVPAVQQKGQQVAAITPGPDSLFAVIERVARDPSIDIGRMQELISMHKALKADNAQAEYDAAMADAQSEMKTVRTNKSNSQTSSKYANYEALDKAIRPIYTKHGFALSFNTGDSPTPESVRLLCTVSHRGGHRQEYKIDVPADGKGARGGDVMTKTHAMGAAAQYGQRYLFKLIFNLSTGDDDDGNSAASIEERAKVMADKGIMHLNSLSPPTKETLAKWDNDNAKSIAWLKKNAPDQFERYQTAYSNAAQAAGISKEEPRRGKNDKVSTAASPHSEPSGSEALRREDDRSGGGDRKPEATATPAPITDVKDENAPIEFDTFNTARELLDWSSKWVTEPERTVPELEAWHAHFKSKIDEYLQHKFAWIKDSMTETFAQFVKLTAKPE